jgi:predicted Zn-dependent protease
MLAICLFFLCAGGSFIYFSLFGDPPVNGTKVLQKTTEAVSKVKYYTADVYIQPEGNASSSSVINGTVAYDVSAGNMSGTFSVPMVYGKASPRLGVEVISFSGATYAKFRVKNASDDGVVKYPEDWILIGPGEKGPDQFVVLGESLAFYDVLELFRKGGKYLVVDGQAEKQIGGDAPGYRFSLRPSLVESLHPQGVSEEFDTVLKEGDINVWVSAKDKSVTEVRFSARGYMVTMKIKNQNKTVEIKQPAGALSLSEWRSKQFSEFVPKGLVSEIFIGSYGNIKKEYLDAIKTAVEKETGIKATILLSGPALPEKAPLFSVSRKQFDAVSVFTSVKNASLKYGDKTRFIYVLDMDTYSSVENGKDSVWYMDEVGANTTLMSLYGLRKISDSDSNPAEQSLVIARAQKIALRVLGTSVGFGLSPSTEMPTCLMYKTNSLAELDAEGAGYCPEEKAVIKKFFGK